MNISAIQFQYNYSAISKNQFKEHFKLYDGYVKKINEIDDLQKNDSISEWEKTSNSSYSQYRGLKQGETFCLNGVIMHELYFQSLGSGESEPLSKTVNVISKHFGSFEQFKEVFKATAMSARGYAVLCLDQRSGMYRITAQDAHDVGLIAVSWPVLVLDMYEHAYLIDYKTDKAAYIDRFLKTANWVFAEKRIR